MVLLAVGLAIFALVQHAEAAKATVTLKVGGPIQMSGKFARYGNNAIKAFEMWKAWVDSQPEVGYKVEFDFRDDSSVTANAVSIAKTMIAANAVDILVAPYSSGASTAVVKEVNGAVPVLVWGGASEGIFAQGISGVFGTFTTAGNYMTTGLDVLKEKGAKTVLFFKNSKSFSKAVCDGAMKHAASLGMEKKGELTVANDGSDVASVLATQGGETDVLVGCGHLADIKELIIRLPTSGVTASAVLATQVGTSTFINDLKTMSMNQTDLACGLLMPTQWVSSDSEAKDPVVGWTAADFTKRFSSLTGSPPTYHTASAGAAAVALSNAISIAGGANDMNAVVSAMQGLDIKSFYGQLKFAADGSLAGKPMYTLQNTREGSEVVAPADVKSMEANYPDTCPEPQVLVEEVTDIKEETPEWVLPVIIVCALLLVVLLVVAMLAWQRMRKFEAVCKELRQAGHEVRKPSFRERLSVAAGKVNAADMGKRVSTAKAQA